MRHSIPCGSRRGCDGARVARDATRASAVAARAAPACDSGRSVAADLVVRRPQGLYCPAGDFYVDPWRKVERAVITHAHADHARTGHRHYLTAQRGVGVLRARLGRIDVTGLGWGEPVTIGDARVSLHPAGHILGSAQVRIEVGGEVWVLAGDYFVSTPRRRQPDLRRLRAGALRLLRHRGHVRPADLPLAAPRRRVRRHEPLVAGQRRGRRGERGRRVQPRQDAARAGRRRRRPSGRSTCIRPPRRSTRRTSPRASRCRRRATWSELADARLAARRADRRAAERAGAVALAARGARARVVRQRLDAAARRAPSRAASTAASC